MNMLNPALMSGEERRAEVVEYLAAAILRHRARQVTAKQRKSVASQLDCRAASSLPVPRMDT
jgi:hypothetical protein